MTRVFQNLKAGDLKSARQVCRTWNEEAVVRLNPKIILCPNISESNSSSHASIFLKKYRVRSHIYISLLDHSWFIQADRDACYYDTEYWAQQNNMDYFWNLLSSILSAESAQLIDSLHLELVIRNEKDAEIFGEILSVTRNLRVLFLDLVSFEDSAILAIPVPATPDGSVRNFGIRLHGTQEHPAM